MSHDSLKPLVSVPTANQTAARALAYDDMWMGDDRPAGVSSDAQSAAEPAPPRVFLLDDDPIFCKLMEKVAKRNGIPLTVCSSLKEFGSDRRHLDFDVAIIDYYLEDLTGPDVISLLEDRPVVLVSRNADCADDGPRWPESIKKFVAKKQGPEVILDTAITLSRPL